jgi:hypothetical protein
MWQTVSYYAVLALEALCGVFGLRLYEEPRYQVIDRVGVHVEVRHYGTRLAAEIELPLAGRDRAFRVLFAYIAGDNRALAQSSRIAMTVPVQVANVAPIAMTVPVQASETPDKIRMRFFLPASYTLASAPTPTDSRVKIKQIADETVAVLRFSGNGRDVADRQTELIASLAGSRWQPAGKPYALFYDAPFTVPFLRRNEAAVAVVAAR